jgi:hypothetical protein
MIRIVAAKLWRLFSTRERLASAEVTYSVLVLEHKKYIAQGT